MQTRLRGSARQWYDQRDEYNLTWEQWKSELTATFPRHVEFADVLEEMMTRRKEEDEMMTYYFHQKMALVRRCRMDDEAALLCVIRGLPVELQAHAKSFEGTTPHGLYVGFLAMQENYKCPAAAARLYGLCTPTLTPTG